MNRTRSGTTVWVALLAIGSGLFLFGSSFARADEKKPADNKPADNKSPEHKPIEIKPLGPAPSAEPGEEQPAGDEFARQPTWSAPTEAAVRTEVFKWLGDRKADDAAKKEAEALWPTDAKPADVSSAELLDRVVKTIALVDAPARDLLDFCAKPHKPEPLAKRPWLTDDKSPAFVRNNFRLYYGRWLAQEKLYDDSLEQLNTLEPGDVVDPGSLLFYQSVDHHWLLHKEPGLKTIARLLERKQQVPRRYAQMAELMQADLAALKDESLDHIARRMRDTERRLDLGHAGKKVRGVEDGIIASLDKMIDDLEKQQNGGGGGGGSRLGRGGSQSSSPAPDSAPLVGKGPGNVDKKPIGNKANWGDLPAKERQEVLQAIGKEFPSHFRDVIEQYFKKLASDEREP
jgi:hypothetical protein